MAVSEIRKLLNMKPEFQFKILFCVFFLEDQLIHIADHTLPIVEEFGLFLRKCALPVQKVTLSFFFLKAEWNRVKDFGPELEKWSGLHSVIHAIRPELVDLEKVKGRPNRETWRRLSPLLNNWGSHGSWTLKARRK